MTKIPKPPTRVILSPVMSYDNSGQFTVPNHLNLGSDGRLNLTHDGDASNPKAKPQPISLKESIAWFRLGYDYNWSVTKGEGISEWLKLIDQALF